mmetsp:Transcript_4623/g.7556  ORF Transcript_4623/g.7556 Transcript_4623/m.7556 type:complete len:239 (-) Transcript_4623:476-1192(-)
MHPFPHGIDDIDITVGTGVGVIITTGISIIGCPRCCCATPFALTSAGVAVRQAIWYTRRVALPVVARQHQTNRVIRIVVLGTIGILEQLCLKAAVVFYRAAFHQNAALVAHVAARGARGLLVGVVILHGVAGGRDGAVALLRLLGVPRVPDLDFLHIFVTPASRLEGIFEVGSIVIARVWVTHQHVRFSAKQNLQVGDEIIRQSSSHIVAEFGQITHNIIRGHVLGCVDAETRESDGE